MELSTLSRLVRELIDRKLDPALDQLAASGPEVLKLLVEERLDLPPDLDMWNYARGILDFCERDENSNRAPETERALHLALRGAVVAQPDGHVVSQSSVATSNSHAARTPPGKLT